MTCIVGIARDGKVYMGGDSCGSDYYSWQSVSNPKVFVNGQYLIGCTSSFRMIDLLHYDLVVPEQDDKYSEDMHIRTTFIKAVRKCFKDNGFLTNADNGEAGGNFLLGYRGKLYEVQTDFSVLNCPSWGAAVGSGEAPARGSLYTTRDDWDCRKRVIQSLEAAEAVVPSVRGPFVVLEQ